MICLQCCAKLWIGNSFACASDLLYFQRTSFWHWIILKWKPEKKIESKKLTSVPNCIYGKAAVAGIAADLINVILYVIGKSWSISLFICWILYEGIRYIIILKLACDYGWWWSTKISYSDKYFVVLKSCKVVGLIKAVWKRNV